MIKVVVLALLFIGTGAEYVLDEPDSLIGNRSIESLVDKWFDSTSKLLMKSGDNTASSPSLNFTSRCLEYLTDCRFLSGPGVISDLSSFNRTSDITVRTTRDDKINAEFLFEFKTFQIKYDVNETGFKDMEWMDKTFHVVITPVKVVYRMNVYIVNDPEDLRPGNPNCNEMAIITRTAYNDISLVSQVLKHPRYNFHINYFLQDILYYSMENQVTTTFYNTLQGLNLCSYDAE